MRVSHRFRVGGVTRMFTATVVLQLAGEGVLSLDDSVEHWLPGRVPDGAAIRIRHLLSHTSGLDDASTTPVAPAGASFHQASKNYTLLGDIVEAATGQPFATTLRARVLAPLGLTATSFPGRRGEPNLARGYTPRPRPVDVTDAFVESLLPSDAGVVSNARDLTRFLSALLGRRLLRPAERAALTSDPVPTDPSFPSTGYALGVYRIGSPCGAIWGSRGRIVGYTTFAFASSDGTRSAALLLNVGELNDPKKLITLGSMLGKALCPRRP